MAGSDCGIYIFFTYIVIILWRVFLQTLDDYPLRDHPELAELPGFGELAPKRSVLIYLRKARCGTLGHQALVGHVNWPTKRFF